MDVIERRRGRPHRGILVAGTAAWMLVAAPAARADDLSVTTREHGDWNEALAALRADLAGEGKTIHIAVRAQGAPVACGGYRLQLDPEARAAFRVGACDPVMRETPLVLVRRAALFDEGFDVPRPRTLSITAVITATAVASGGPQGGSAVRCSVAVQPYLDDLLHGTRVLLTPDRYWLRPGSASITVSPEPGGWSLHAAELASFRIAYEVLDRATGDVVLRQDTTLLCGPEAVLRAPASSAHVEDAPAPVRESPPAAAPLSPFATRTPPATAVSEPPVAQCRWGKGRKGCNTSPLGVTIWAGFLTTAALTTSVGFFTAAGLDHGNSQGFRIGGGIALAPTVIWGTIFAGLLYDLHRDRRAKSPRPTFWMSNEGGGLGSTGSF